MQAPAPHDVLVALLQTHNHIERLGEALFSPLGLTAAQFNILNLLALGGGEMEQANLGAQLLVGRSSLSIVLGRMVRRGLVRRQVHHRDRRQAILVITSKGQTLWEKISPEYEETVRKIFGRISDSRRKQMVAGLAAYDEGLKKTLAVRVAVSD